MSSTPTVPVVKITTPPTELGIVSAYLKAHERLIIVALVIALSAWGLQKWDNHAAAAADTRAAIADANAATTDKTAAQSLAILQQALAEKNATNQILAQQNAALAAAITSRQAAVVVQQKTDTTLEPSALASRIATLSSAPPAEVTLEGVNINLGHNAALAVVQSLEVIPVLQANVKDETDIAKNLQTELNNANGLLTTQGTAIMNLNTARTADAAACVADKNKAVAAVKKSRWHWVERAAEIGLVVGIWAGTHIH